MVVREDGHTIFPYTTQLSRRLIFRCPPVLNMLYLAVSDTGSRKSEVTGSGRSSLIRRWGGIDINAWRSERTTDGELLPAGNHTLQRASQVRLPYDEPLPDWSPPNSPGAIRRPVPHPMPDDGGADSWQSTRRAPRPAGNPGDLQRGAGGPALRDQPRVLGQPEPITTGRGARIGRRAVVITLAIVVVLAAVGYGIYSYLRVPPLTDLSAQVVSSNQIDLGFPQSGVLSRVLVHTGEHVAAGVLLAQETVAGLDQQVTADKQEVSNDEAIIKQLNTLLGEVNYEVSIDPTKVDTAAENTAPLQVDLANANSQLLRDRSQLSIATATAAEQEIRAPAAGTVMSISGQPGEVVTGAGVSGTSSTGGAVVVTPHFQLFPSQQSVAGSASASPVILLQTSGPTLINVVVPETQIGLVRLGSPVTITPSVSGLGPVSGTVTEIFSSSVVAAGQVSYEVQVTVVSHHDEHALLPGMTATATIRH